MSFRFVIGRAGSGKTYYCLNSIKKDLIKNKTGKNLILLVPEQATFQNELELTSTKELEGIMRAEVLSFRRLTLRILQEVGGVTRSHIGDLGKKMLIRKFLENRKDDLKIFKGASKKTGFVESVENAISEFKLYQVRLPDLAKLLTNGIEKQSLLFSKLNDLFLIYEDLETYLTDRFVDPDDYLDLLADRAHLSNFVQNSEIWIDGFTGFTPQELKVIEALIKNANCVSLTVNLDPVNFKKNSQGVFAGPYKTYTQIEEIVIRNNIKTEEPVLLNKEKLPRFNSKTLMYLEENNYNYIAEAFTGKEKEDLRIISAHNFQVEVEEVARQIRNLCREEKYRYKDIGVFLRNFDNYDMLIEAVFKLYEIPFFIDRKRTVMHHPIIELIISALNIAQDGLNYEDLFRYLKTDLLDITRDEVDILENIILARGIRSLRLEDYPIGAVEELLSFKEEIKTAKCVQAKAEAIYTLLINLETPKKLDNWAQVAEESGNIEKARQHSQIWDGVIDVLEQLVEVLGQEELALDNFSKIIYSGFENLKVGLIPPGLDQVLVGSLERSRNPDLKAVFIMGVSDGVLPARFNRDGLIDDRERDLIKDKGISLAPGRKEKTNQEQFLVYTALTRASEKLILTYPLTDTEGKALRPSSIIKRIRELFPAISEEMVGINPSGNDDLQFINHPNKTLSYLANKIRSLGEGEDVNQLWWAVYNWFLEDPWRKKLERTVEGLNHSNTPNPVPVSITKKLYENPLRISVSRIEKYHACPFSHFLTYGLSLREREIYKFENLDLGQFFHQAMERFTKELKKQEKDWADITISESQLLIKEITEEITPKLQNKILLSTARFRYLTQKFQKTLNRSVLILKEHARRGSFRPVGIEMNFGFNNTEIPGLKFTLEDGSTMEIVGQIDRVDASYSDNKCYLRVIDYKSGKADLSLLEVYYGFKLQLLTYLDVIMNHFEKQMSDREVVPAGVFYFYLRNPILNVNRIEDEAEIEEEILKDLKMRGLSLADLAVLRLTDREMTSSGTSSLFPVGIKKAGEKALNEGEDLGDRDIFDVFTKASKLVTKEQIKIMTNYIRKLIITSGQEMLSGNLSLTPYKHKDFSPCIYCVFKPVCQFDTELQDNEYRIIEDIKEEEIWEKLEGCEE